jgi:hypothetical protein
MGPREHGIEDAAELCPQRPGAACADLDLPHVKLDTPVERAANAKELGVLGISVRCGRLTAFAALVCFAALAAPATAGAGTVSLVTFTLRPEPSVLSFVAASGETNHVVIVQEPNGYRVIDLGVTLTVGTGFFEECASVNANEAFCLGGVGLHCDLGCDGLEDSIPPAIRVAAGDLDDFVSVSAFLGSSTISGDDGEDLLEVVGGQCPEQLKVKCVSQVHGGAGDDTLIGASTAARLDGGPGADMLNGAREDAATVAADYSMRVNPVTVDPDGVADDGEAGEGDNVGAGIDLVIGGSGDDTLMYVDAYGEGGNDTLIGAVHRDLFPLVGSSLVGGAGNDLIMGNNAADYLSGGAGNDSLTGRADNDYLVGGAGADALSGGAGSDFLSGQGGSDSLIGGSGHDRMFGGRGRDTLRARDGARDRVGGGGGTDRARVDAGLDVVRSIEAFF